MKVTVIGATLCKLRATISIGTVVWHWVVGTRWVYIADLVLNVLRVPPGFVTDANCDLVADPALEGTSNFAAGVWSLADECGIPGRPQVKRLSQEEELLASHGVIIAQDPPPDEDFSIVDDWSLDGRYMLIVKPGSSGGGLDIWYWRLSEDGTVEEKRIG